MNHDNSGVRSLRAGKHDSSAKRDVAIPEDNIMRLVRINTAPGTPLAARGNHRQLGAIAVRVSLELQAQVYRKSTGSRWS